MFALCTPVMAALVWYTKEKGWMGRVIAAGWSGKIKTSCTMVGLIAMMIFPGVQILDTVVCAVILVTTLYSGFEYFQKNWDVLMPGA